MTPLSDNEILERYFATLPMSLYNTKQLFAIGFIGLPGTGKSTVARALKEHLQLPLSSNDHFRRYLNLLGFEGSSPRSDLMPVFAEARTEWYYRHHTSVIIDANFSEQRHLSEKLAAKYGAKLLLIRTTCPEEVAINRIEKRQADNKSEELSRAGIDAYIRAKQMQLRHPTEHVFADIETDKPIEPQIKAVLEHIQSLDYV